MSCNVYVLIRSSSNSSVSSRFSISFSLIIIYFLSDSKEQTGDIITFAQFEEGGLISETCNDTESGDESDSESIMMSEQDMENIDEKEKFDDDLIGTETLHDICDGNQTHPNIDKREARLEIHDRIKQKK